MIPIGIFLPYYNENNIATLWHYIITNLSYVSFLFEFSICTKVSALEDKILTKYADMYIFLSYTSPAWIALL